MVGGVATALPFVARRVTVVGAPIVMRACPDAVSGAGDGCGRNNERTTAIR